MTDTNTSAAKKKTSRPSRQRPAARSGGSLQARPEPLQVGDQEEQQPAAAAAQPEPAKRPRAGGEGKPKYETLIRSEARLWPEQVEALGRVRRRVAAERTEKLERISDNTLIRVAVDLLLAHADELSGNSEDELRNSVVPEETDSQAQ